MLSKPPIEGIFTTYDSLNLFQRSWIPLNKPKALLVILHGLGEHSARYDHFAQFMALNDYLVNSFDYRGHGKSEGQRFFVNSIDEYCLDVENFILSIRSQYPELPIFIFSHSMGGLISTTLVSQDRIKVDGLIASSAVVKISDEMSSLTIKLAGITAAIAPKMGVLGGVSDQVCRDPEVVRSHREDPLIQGKLPAKTMAEILKAVKWLGDKMGNITIPILIMTGSADTMADSKGSKDLYQKCSSKDKTLKIWEGLYHELLNEPEKDQVMAEVLAWTNSHIK
jgi:alpha-beta hydrolase superfamily lysophospholipase